MSTRLRGAAVLVMIAAVAIAVIAYFGGSEGEPGRVRSSLSLAAPFFVAGLIAWVSERRGRPRYVMMAGMALIPISIISIVTIPVIAPALVLIVAGARASRAGWSVEMPASLVMVAGIVLSMVALLWVEDPASWTTADGHHHGASDVITGTESVVSLAFLAVAFALAWFVTDRPASGSAPVTRSGRLGV